MVVCETRARERSRVLCRVMSFHSCRREDEVQKQMQVRGGGVEKGTDR